MVVPQPDRAPKDPEQLPAEAGDSRRVALSIAEEIADLSSAIESTAFDLVAAAPERSRLPRAAKLFLASVQRLRALHSKLVAFANEALPVAGTADLGEVVASLTEELMHLRLGLEIDTELAPGLPPAAAGPESVRNALLFVCSAMFRAEPRATHLSIAAERCFAGAEPQLRVELRLETIADAHGSGQVTRPNSSAVLAIEAATRLIESHGGEVAMDRLAGGAVRTLLRLPAAEAVEIIGPPMPLPPVPHEPQPAMSRHGFGGALVVEADPDVRAMLAKELRAVGRAVFACADCTAARAFLEATPDRFELLIIDQQHRLDDNDALGEAIRRLTPELKICVLGPAEASAWPDLQSIKKPFGVHELRQALASVLGA